MLFAQVRFRLMIHSRHTFTFFFVLDVLVGGTILRDHESESIRVLSEGRYVLPTHGWGQSSSCLLSDLFEDSIKPVYTPFTSDSSKMHECATWGNTVRDHGTAWSPILNDSHLYTSRYTPSIEEERGMRTTVRVHAILPSRITLP